MDQILALGTGRIQVIAPAVRGRKGEHEKLLERIRKDGYVRVRIDGEVYDINDLPKLNKNQKHTIDVVVDRLSIKPGVQSRLTESLETAFAFGEGLAKVDVIGGEELLFSQNYACPDCGVSMEELTPRMFSFNNPYGACPHCGGLGILMKMDEALVVPDPTLSCGKALSASAAGKAARKTALPACTLGPWRSTMLLLGHALPGPAEQARHAILYGTGNDRLHIAYQREFGAGTFDAPFEGIIPNLERRYKETQSDGVKQELESYMSSVACPACGGKRLKPESLAVTVGGLSIAALSDLTVRKAQAFLQGLELNETERRIGEQIFKELHARLGFWWTWA